MAPFIILILDLKRKTYINPSGIELNYLVSRLDGYDQNDVSP